MARGRGWAREVGMTDSDDGAGQPSSGTGDWDDVGWDPASESGAIRLRDWWLIPGHYGILPNRLYWLLGADRIGSRGENEWYTLLSTLRLVAPHWTQDCGANGDTDSGGSPGSSPTSSAAAQRSAGTEQCALEANQDDCRLGSGHDGIHPSCRHPEEIPPCEHPGQGGWELRLGDSATAPLTHMPGVGRHIATLPLDAEGLRHCVGNIAAALGGLVFRPPLPACSQAEVILGQACRALHAWFNVRFELPASGMPSGRASAMEDDSRAQPPGLPTATRPSGLPPRG